MYIPPLAQTHLIGHRQGSVLHLQNDEEGKEHEDKEQQAAGVQREQVVLVREVWLKGEEKETVSMYNKLETETKTTATTELKHTSG